jgi:NADPH-dependent 2,4-dienoyl-CoA reductase/sulfur reductase-like enzyme
MKTFPYVIAGGGMVAGYAAKEMVERGLKAGELCIVSADRALPYERPPLSKGFLAGKETEESIRINAPEFYQAHGIDVRLRTRITGLDAGRKTVQLESGDEVGFGNLILATGSEIRTLNAPGRDLAGICYLRSIDDSERIQREAENSKHTAVIGGGFIGMETAAVLAQKGAVVTMILREDRIWKQFFTPAMSKFFERYYAERGVRFVKEAKIARITGKGEVSGVAIEGGKTVDVSLVVAGIGVRPATDVFRHSGLDVSDGVVVDEFLETAHPGIYAAGDIANYEDTIFGKRRRVEHWDNAVSQGQHCARALMGDRVAFKHVPYFFSDVFDLSYELWGDPSVADESVERGDLSSGKSFSVWWLAKGRVVAAFVMNRPDEEREVAPKWIEAQRDVNPGRLGKAEKIGEAIK